jgi:hypothetical protein
VSLFDDKSPLMLITLMILQSSLDGQAFLAMYPIGMQQS